MPAQNQLEPVEPATAVPKGTTMDTRDWVLLAVQIFLTGLITYIAIAFWAITASGYTEGLQVVGFAVGSALITITAFVIGLPLRIVRPARRWWFRHGMWFLALLVLGVGGMVVSYFVGDAGPVHYADSEWPSTDGYAPDDRLFVPSLFALALATMHLRPPTRREHKTVNA
ncbi:hypothetical protein J7E45_09275 [Microbacterium sp. ISL-59]|uniref:hypothetical protein n=1 Tax=Microbacterium sp. ISL-59 TaxID=2819159 RepID=UPI001BE5B332|nr:hypothetical protein [Microbacterium sp. ISL-59]MBT2495799.1 hypothetical protein [Microbacterium sp. ISL-59]